MTDTGGVPVSGAAVNSDPDGDKLSISAIAVLPAHRTAVINKNNTVSYSPAAGLTGIDVFQYQIEDGKGGLAVASVTITVQ